MKTARERWSRMLALLGCVTVAATFVAYSFLLQQQAIGLGEGQVGLFGDLQGAPTWLLVTFAATVAATGTAGFMPFGRARQVTLGAAAAVLLVVGFLGIFSVGLPLLVAAGIAVGAAGADAGSVRARAA